MIKTQSATPLAAVMVEQNNGCTDVWLRKNIKQELIKMDDLTMNAWTADEVHLLVAGTPTVSEIEADFERWWAQAEDAEKTPEERTRDNTAAIDEIALAVAELGELIGGVDDGKALCATD